MVAWRVKYCIVEQQRDGIYADGVKEKEVTHRAENIPREYLRRIWVLLRVVFDVRYGAFGGGSIDQSRRKGGRAVEILS